MCVAACEPVWLRRLLQDAGEEQIEATIINCDNQSSIKLAYNIVVHKKIKHIGTQFHLLGKMCSPKRFVLNIVILVIILLIYLLSLWEY